MELIKNIANNSFFEHIEDIVTDSDRKCPYCGKSYRNTAKTYRLRGEIRTVNFEAARCDCEKRKREEEEEAARIAREIKRKKEKTAKLFDNSLMTPFFREKTFSNLIETPEIIRCKQFVTTFEPNKSKGIQMFGEPGTGKTTALAAVCNELMERDYNCLFTPLSTLLDKFSAYSYRNSGDVTELLNWLVTFDFVVLDDIGRETYTDKRKENVFRIIDALMNFKVVTAFTANPNMMAKLKSIPELEAALDRLKDMCPIRFEFKGESYRGKQIRLCEEL